MYSMKARPAPDFSLSDQDGVTRTLRDYRGRWLVLYFYPRDNTPACTTEACAFRDEHQIIAQFGNAEVIGVSKDSVASHKKFAESHHLNFPLLSDPEHKVIEAYGAWQLKKFMGREFMGIQRSTVLINPAGQIVQEFPKVVPKKHAHEIIEALQHHQGLASPA